MELSQMIKKITGFEGEIVTDPTKPDGMMRRICDNTKIYDLGWRAKISLEAGIRELDEFYLKKDGMTAWLNRLKN